MNCSSPFRTRAAFGPGIVVLSLGPAIKVLVAMGISSSVLSSRLRVLSRSYGPSRQKGVGLTRCDLQKGETKSQIGAEEVGPNERRQHAKVASRTGESLYPALSGTRIE